MFIFLLINQNNLNMASGIYIKNITVYKNSLRVYLSMHVKSLNEYNIDKWNADSYGKLLHKLNFKQSTINASYLKSHFATQNENVSGTWDERNKGMTI